MPIPPSVQGYTGLNQVTQLTIENNKGEQLLLPQTAGAATLSLTTQPNAAGGGTVGMQLHFYVIGNTASGTITIAGTGVGGAALPRRPTTSTPAPINTQGWTEFCTSEIFVTVNASGITLSSGLTTAGCQIMVFGSLAGKFLLPAETDGRRAYWPVLAY